MDERELEALHQTLFRLEQRWLPPLPETAVFFGYDPLPIALFLAGIRVAMEHAQGKRFLDVGCGIGTKLAFMHALGYQVAGIDRHEPYVAAARELMPEATLTVADAFDLTDFDADIVYMYRPAVTDDLERALERHVVERLAPGTVLFLPTRHLSGALRVTRVGGHVWVI